MGFDEVRVRYRQQRRAVVREVILRCLLGEEQKQFVADDAEQHVPQIDRDDFIDDVFEDLEGMDESRLVGLGITPDQLREWIRLRKGENR